MGIVEEDTEVDEARAQLEAYVGGMLRLHQRKLYRNWKRAAQRDAEYLRETSASTHSWMDPEENWLEREYAALYDNTLRSLPPACRSVFIAVREDEQSYEEAAESLGTSVKMVAKHMTEAHRIFREALRAYGIEPPREKAGRRSAGGSNRSGERAGAIRTSAERPRFETEARATRSLAASPSTTESFTHGET